MTIKVLAEHDFMANFWAIRSEYSMLANMSHQRVIRPKGILFRPLRIVFPLAPQGSLLDHIEFCPGGFQDQISHKLLYQVCHNVLCIIVWVVKSIPDSDTEFLSYCLALLE